MAKMVRVTQAAGMASSTADDEVLLINAEMVMRIDDTDENYAGDSRILMSDGSAIYVTESLAELEKRINTK